MLTRVCGEARCHTPALNTCDSVIHFARKKQNNLAYVKQELHETKAGTILLG